MGPEDNRVLLVVLQVPRANLDDVSHPVRSLVADQVANGTLLFVLGDDAVATAPDLADARVSFDSGHALCAQCAHIFKGGSAGRHQGGHLFVVFTHFFGFFAFWATVVQRQLTTSPAGAEPPEAG